MNKQSILLTDRYLPLRHHSSHSLSNCSDTASTTSSSHLQLLSSPSRILSFAQPPLPSCSLSSLSHQCQKIKQKADKLMNLSEVSRDIYPENVIQAPGVIDNFYHNCLDASSLGLLAIGLQDGCYLYNQKVCLQITEKKGFHTNCPTSIKLNKCGSILFAGHDLGDVKVVDVGKLIVARTLVNHKERIGCLQNVSDSLLLTGSKDRQIALSDIRRKSSKVLTVFAHNYQVCGLSKQHNSIASSDSSGTIHIWDLRKSQIFSSHRIFQSSAVKAIQWCPWKYGLLAAGGGSKDHRIILLNSFDGQVKKTVKGGSQVTALKWRQQTRSLTTTHGSGLAVVWNTEKFSRKAILVRHLGRIVGLTQGNRSIWTLGADQTLRSWQIDKENNREEKSFIEKGESFENFNIK